MLNPNALSGQTMEILKGHLSQPLGKAGYTAPTSATDGIANYDLEPRAKLLFPVKTPLRNRIPRAMANGGIQANWRAITGINTGHSSPGVSEGNRNAADTHTYADYFAAYRELGREDYVTWKAEYAAVGFDDAKALAVDNLLRATMISEEVVDLGGNTSLQLGTTPTPTLVGSTTGGTLAAQTWSVICVALTLDGYIQVAGINDGTTGESVSIPTATLSASITRTNIDGSSDTYGGGVAQKSTNATATTTGTTSSIAATVTWVNGAYAYAWFWGTAGSEVLGAVTTLNSVLITAAATGTQTAAALPSADNSTNALVYDGLLTMLAKSGVGAYFATQPTGTAGTGTPLTSDGAGGIVEFNNAFAAFWNGYRISPQVAFINAREAVNINSKIIAGGGAPLFRFNADANSENMSVVGGMKLKGLINKITGELVELIVHPFIPPGTILFYSDTLDYPLSGVQQLIVKRLRYDYRAMEWPVVKRRYEYGVYFDGVLQNYFFPAYGVLTNVGNG